MKNSPGDDRVSPEMIADLPLVAMKLFLYIINAMLRQRYFSQTWKINQHHIEQSKLFKKRILKVFISLNIKTFCLIINSVSENVTAQ